MGMTMTQICEDLANQGVGGKQQIKNMLQELALLAEDQLSQGEDFTVPGICKLTFAYRKPKKKGERWTKGQEVQGFGGMTTVKDSDSPPVTPKVTLKAAPLGKAAKCKVGSKPDAQAAFLKTAAGKSIAKRKG